MSSTKSKNTTKIPSSIKKKRFFNAELNFEICNLRAQGLSYGEISEIEYKKTGKMRSTQFYQQIVRLYKKKFEEEGML